MSKIYSDKKFECGDCEHGFFMDSCGGNDEKLRIDINKGLCKYFKNQKIYRSTKGCPQWKLRK